MIILSEKIFSHFQTNQIPGIAMRFHRQKLPLTCNQGRGTPVKNFVGQDVIGAISLGREVGGAGGSGAGNRESNYGSMIHPKIDHH